LLTRKAARARLGCEIDANFHLSRRIRLQLALDAGKLLVDRALLQA
jgi:hypothetical protein